jgi:predicted ATPase
MAAFYNTLKTQSRRQFESLNKSLPQLIPAIERVDVIRTDQGKLRLQVYELGAPYSAQVVSEGTLRILGLLAITTPLSPTTVVGYEEPENGVHPRRLRVVADLLSYAADSGKQILVNTHSPNFPEFFTKAYGRHAALVMCRRVDRATHFEHYDSVGPLFVRQEVADEIDRAELDTTSLAQRIMRGDFGG